MPARTPPETEQQILHAWLAGDVCEQELAERFGVSRKTVGRIILRLADRPRPIPSSHPPPEIIFGIGRNYC